MNNGTWKDCDFFFRENESRNQTNIMQVGSYEKEVIEKKKTKHICFFFQIGTEKNNFN